MMFLFVQNRGIRSQFYKRQVSSGKSMDDAWDGIVFHSVPDFETTNAIQNIQ